MDASQYKDYVLVLLFIKYILNKYAGVPYAPITAPEVSSFKDMLDGMLDFCFDEGMLALYKKLCRYYFFIAPDATVSYICAYRDLWDTEQGGQGE